MSARSKVGVLADAKTSRVYFMYTRNGIFIQFII